MLLRWKGDPASGRALPVYRFERSLAGAAWTHGLSRPRHLRVRALTRIKKRDDYYRGLPAAGCLRRPSDLRLMETSEPETVSAA